MGQDQNAEMPRGLDEPGRGDRLSGGRGVAEPVAADRAGVGARELAFEYLLFDVSRVVVVVLLVELRLGNGPVVEPFPFSSAERCVEAISSASIPVSASTWWRRSSVPAAVCAGSSVSTRSRPSISP